MTMIRYSEPYQATGGLAAEGVINQLGRPDIEPLEVLVREAVQNCWDARRETSPAIRVEIGRIAARRHDRETRLGTSPPRPASEPAARCGASAGAHILYFADFGTGGLAGPTRADRVEEDDVRDFVDFVRNIGQPPDKDFGGGSFGYGKAAFYIASKARTIVVDTLCETRDGPERRLIGAALGANYTEDGQTYTGRHWWGAMVDGVPEALTGDQAAGRRSSSVYRKGRGAMGWDDGRGDRSRRRARWGRGARHALHRGRAALELLAQDDLDPRRRAGDDRLPTVRPWPAHPPPRSAHA